MSQQHQPYQEYKYSGFPWLGQIPARWEIKRLKFVAPASAVKLTDKPNDLLYIGLENIESGTGRLLMETQPETVESNVGIFEKGDILFGKLRPYLAKVAQADFQGSCTTELLALQPQKIDGRFLFYSLLSPRFIETVNAMTYGTKMPRVSWEQIGSLSLSLPPLPEQRAIAAFLDHQTAKIDALITKKQRLLELLHEKRAALISQAVTKGLNPVVKMKDSGVEWLGSTPSHWKLMRAKFIFQKISRPIRDEDDVVTAFRDGQVTLRSNRRTEGFTFSIKEIGYQGVRKGDLIIHQMDGFAGAIGVSDSDGKCTPIYSICQPIIPASTHFYAYLLRHMAKSDFILSLTKGIRERSSDFRFDVFKELVLPIPQIEEQCSIVSYIDSQTKQNLALQSKVESAIERLREYRSALISSAVTGKIDVREEI